MAAELMSARRCLGGSSRLSLKHERVHLYVFRGLKGVRRLVVGWKLEFA